MTPHAHQIARLHTELEAALWRVSALEAMVKGEDWDAAVPPLSLQQTRAMRLIARKPVSPARLVSALACDYPRITPNSLTVTIFRCRKKLPPHIAPRILPSAAAPFEVADPDALRAFLAGEMELRRAA